MNSDTPSSSPMPDPDAGRILDIVAASLDVHAGFTPEQIAVVRENLFKQGITEASLLSALPGLTERQQDALSETFSQVNTALKLSPGCTGEPEAIDARIRAAAFERIGQGFYRARFLGTCEDQTAARDGITRCRVCFEGDDYNASNLSKHLDADHAVIEVPTGMLAFLEANESLLGIMVMPRADGITYHCANDIINPVRSIRDALEQAQRATAPACHDVLPGFVDVPVTAEQGGAMKGVVVRIEQVDLAALRNSDGSVSYDSKGDLPADLCLAATVTAYPMQAFKVTVDIPQEPVTAGVDRKGRLVDVFAVVTDGRPIGPDPRTLAPGAEVHVVEMPGDKGKPFFDLVRV